MVRTPITHIIYDVDGLLLDTERFYTEVTQSIVAPYGKSFDWSYKRHMIGRAALDSARYLVEALDLPITPQEYLQQREALLQERFPEAEPLPGAQRLTEHFHAHGIPQAVATSSSSTLFTLKTQRHQNWFKRFDCIVTGDDPEVQRGNPAPDIFLLAAQRLGAQPQQCLVFEDAPSGMQAALAAGMSVVVVPDPNMDRGVYQPAQQILTTLHEFKPSDWGLPDLPDQ